MSWFDDVAKVIAQDLKNYATTFLNATKLDGGSKQFFVNPCPFCNHNGCFSLTQGKNVGHCFSCDESGTLIQIVERLHGEIEGRQRLAEWSGIPYNVGSHEPEKAQARERFARIQKIHHYAIDFYHRQLLTTRTIPGLPELKHTPLKYQMNVRRHTKESLKKYNIGYSGNYQELYQELIDQGYEKDEIKEASKLIGLPEGYFVYPYYDAKGNLVRVNCKIFIRTCRGKEKPEGGFHYDCNVKLSELHDSMQTAHENQFKGHVMTSNNLSRGEKDGVFFFDPKEARSKKRTVALLVEGENDVLSTDEAIESKMESFRKKVVVIGMGGNATEGSFDSDFLRRFTTIYEAFDNDDAGDQYRERLSRELPDIPVRSLSIPEEYNDIDLFLKAKEEGEEILQDLIEQAKIVPTTHFKITREFPKHIWHIKNRHASMRYEIDYYARKKGFIGTLLITKNGIISDKKIGDIDALKVQGEDLTRLKLSFSNHLSNFYHDKKMKNGEPLRKYEELLDIFHLTKEKHSITKQIAWYLFNTTSEQEYQHLARLAQQAIKNETDVANIFKEVNGLQNEKIDPFGSFPKIQLAQSMFPKNKDAYMYFAKFVKDGETSKRVPCLISNKKEEIRLDLLKKKDAQSLLLINNKYELPLEVEANVKDVEDLSLQHIWVHKWINGEVPEKTIHPSEVIREIEAFIRMTYYTSDDTVKVLALWIYATYFYTLFKIGFPYLVINGAKGTGKSTLDNVIYLLSFNPTFAVSITGPALYRSVSQFGGTFILDEQENLSDSDKVNASDMAAVIKAGYSDKGKVYRMDKDVQYPQGFTAFGPKVISNILGVEDVIADRSIYLTTYSAPAAELAKLKDTDQYVGELRSHVHGITSRAALSALTHFGVVAETFASEERFETGNARLTQILRPLFTIAKVVGGDYEEKLLEYYRKDIQETKQETALSTLEGKLKFILKSISEEILGYSKSPWVLEQQHEYSAAIRVDKTTNTFELDTIHIKVLAEELSDNPEESYWKREINAAVKNVMGKEWIRNGRATTRLTIDQERDEGLVRRLDGKRVHSGYRYTFNVREFIPKQLEVVEYLNRDKAEAEAPLF